jgi:hypothetical protein
MLVADFCINFSLFCVASFLSLSLLVYSLFSAAYSKFTSSLFPQGYCHWKAWDLHLGCLARQVG